MKKKISPLSTQRPQSYFFIKAKNTNHFSNFSSSPRPPGSLRSMVIFLFWGIKIFLYLNLPRRKIRRSPRSTPRAQRSFRENPHALLGLPGSVGNGCASHLAPWALSLWTFFPLRALRPLWLSIFFFKPAIRNRQSAIHQFPCRSPRFLLA